jgi:uncharacterized protein
MNKNEKAAFNHNSRIKSTATHHFAYGIDFRLFIDHECGAWCLVDDEARSLLTCLKRPFPLSYLKTKFGKNVEGVIKALYLSGIVTIDGKRRDLVYTLAEPIRRPILILHLTNNCNFRCKYCYAEHPESQNMSFELAEKAIETFRNHFDQPITVEFHGGEPLLRTNLIRELASRYSGYADVFFCVQTNASLIDDEMADFLTENKIQVGVSVDGPKEINDRTRVDKLGKGTLDTIVNGLEKLQERGTFPNAVVVLSKYNVGSVEKIIDFLLSVNIKAAKFNPVIMHGRARQDYSELGISPKDYLLAQKRIYKKTEDLLHKGISFLPYDLSIMSKILFTWVRYYCIHKSPCGAGMTTFAVRGDGAVFPCEELIHVSEFKCGNAYFNQADDLINSKASKMCTARVVEEIKECKRCPWKKFCASGCTARAYHKFGQLKKPSDLCLFYQEMFPFLMLELTKNKKMREHLIGTDIEFP